MTNLIVWHRFDVPFWDYASVMAIPAAAAIVVNLALFLWLFRRDIPARFSTESLAPPAVAATADGLPSAKSAAGVDVAKTSAPGAPIPLAAASDTGAQKSSGPSLMPEPL